MEWLSQMITNNNTINTLLTIVYENPYIAIFKAAILVLALIIIFLIYWRILAAILTLLLPLNRKSIYYNEYFFGPIFIIAIITFICILYAAINYCM